MANRQAKVNIGIGFSVDRSGINTLQSDLQKISNSVNSLSPDKMTAGLKQAGQTAQKLDGILDKTFNSNLGTLNVTKFNQELAKSGMTLKTVKNDLTSFGNQGATAYNKLAQGILGTNVQLKQSNKLLDSMATTMMNTVKWGITSSIFNTITSSVQKAYSYVKQLDTSLNDIRIVTDKSADEMDKFADKANKAAKALGASTLDYTKASLIYYQQGLSDEEAAARAETTVKVANVTGQTGSAVSEQLTAVWNGYKVSAQETEQYIDKLAAVAATTAADLEELSIGMSKVASAAKAMGVDFDDLNAQIATIVSVTRQAPESVGTALKTIYARLGDLKVDGVDEFGVKLGEVSSQLQTMGIQILDANGDMRDMTSVMTEVAEKWDTWTRAQQQAAAVAMAGKRQYNNLVALFENWDMYSDALETSRDSLGTLQEQQDIYMESTAAKLERLKATWQGLYDGLINTDEINPLIEGLTTVVDLFDKMIRNFGGGAKALTSFGLIAASVFNQQIGSYFNNAIQQQDRLKKNSEKLATKVQALEIGPGQIDENATAREKAEYANISKQYDLSKKILEIKNAITDEQVNELTNYQKEIGALEEIVALKEDEKNKLLADPDSVVRQEYVDQINEGKTADTIDIVGKENVSISEALAEALNKRIEAQERLDQSKKEEVEANKLVYTYTKDLNTLLKQRNDLEGGKASAKTKEISTNIKAGAEKLLNDEDIEMLSAGQQKFLKNLKETKITQDNLKDVTKEYVTIIEELAIKKKAQASQQKQEDEAALNNIEKEVKEYTELKDQVDTVAKVEQERYNAAKKKDEIEDSFDDIYNTGKSGVNVINTITTITSSLGSLAMSINSINTLFDVWSDKEKTVGQKLSQTLITVGMSLPIVISSINKLNEALGYSTTLQETLNAIRTKAIAKQKLKNALDSVERLNARADLKDTAAQLVLDSAELGITEKMTEAEFKEILAKTTNLKLDESEVSTLYKLVIGKMAAKDATDKLTASNTKLSASMMATPYGWVLAALAAIVAITTIVIKNQEKLRKAEIEAHKERLDEIKANQELIKTNEELYSSYTELYNQYKKTGNATDDLKNKALELADAYNIENGRVLALTKSYKDLAEEANKKRSEELASASSEAVQGSFEAAQLLAKGAGNTWYQQIGNIFSHTFDDSYGSTKYDKSSSTYTSYLTRRNAASDFGQSFISTINNTAGLSSAPQKNTSHKFTQAETEELAEILHSIGITSSHGYNAGITETGGLTFSVDTSDSEAYLNYINDIKKAAKDIKVYQKEEMKESQSDAINEAIDDIAEYFLEESQRFDEEAYKQLSEEVKLQKEYGLRSEFSKNLYNLNKEDNLNIDAVYDQVEKLKETYKDAFNSADFASIISDELNYYNLNDNFKVKIEFLLELDKSNEITKEIKDTVKKLNNQQIAYLQLHLDTKPAEEDLIQWLNDPNTKKLLEYQGVFGRATTQKDFLLKATDKGFKEEDIESFFSDEDANNLSISKDRFMALDSGEQITQVVTDYINNINKLENAHDELKENYDSLLKNAEEKLADFEELNQSTRDEIENITDGNPLLEGKSDEIIEALAAFSDPTKKLTDEQRELINEFKTLGNIEDLTNYKEYAANLTKLNNTVIQYKNNIKELNETQRDHIEIIKQLNNAQKANNSIIDGLQSKYKSLSSIVDNYNKTKKFSIDDVQSLMEMEDQYVAQLSFENGHLKLNEDGFKAATLAKIDNMIATEELAYQEKVLAIETIVMQNANNTALQAELLHAQGLEALGMVAVGTTATMKDLKAAMDNIHDYGGAAAQAALEQAEKAHENRLKSLKGLRKEIENSSGLAFKNLMSGGSGSSKDKDKKWDEEFDRYWEFKKAIDMLDKSMARLQKTQSKLHGKELIDSLKKENELLEQQKANYDALLHAQEREAGELQGKLDYFGATFADNGELTNYADVTKKMLEGYTSGTVSEKAYEDFKKALERYDSLYYSEIQDTLDKLDDARRKQLENNLKGWETEIQIKLDLTEAKRNWNDFVRDLEQDFRKIYEDLTIESAFDTKNFETYNDDLNTTLQAINDVENEITKLASTGRSDMFESMSEAQEKLKDLGNELIENGKSLYELYESVWDNYINKLDQAADNLNDINDEFGHITNELEYERKLIELIYGDKAYDKMTKYYDAQQKNINMQIDSLKTQRDFWEDQFQAAYMMNKDEHNVILNDMSTWTEDMRKAYDQMIESQESLNDKITEGIENLTDNYLNKLAETFDKLENAVWNMNLDALSDDWDRITGLADEYLDDVEGIYQIQTLANKIDKDIDNTSDIKAAQKLQAFREKEIAILKQKDNLTQTDVDLAEARYQIMLKEIALEDARNAKNSMKLTRNTSGNWTYQYVADDEDVANKRQDLLQGYQDLYKMADDAYQHSMELLMNTWQEMQEKMQEAAELYKNDSEKLAEEQLKIRETYAPMMEAAAENSELYRQEAVTASSAVFSEACDQDAETYQYLTDLQKELVDGVKDKHLEDYEAIRSAVIDGIYPEIAAAAQSAFLETNLNSSTAAADIIHQWADDDGESVKAKLNEAIDSIEDNVKEFEDELNIMKEVAGEDFGNVDKEIQGTIDWLDKMGNKTSDMTKKSTDQLDIMRTAVNELGLKFEELTEKIFETAQKMAEYKEATAAAVEEMIRLNIEKSKFDGSEYTAGYGPGSGGGDTTSKYKLVSDPYGADTLGLMKDGKYIKITEDKDFSAYSDPYGASGTMGITSDGKLTNVIKGGEKEAKEFIKKQIAESFGVSVDEIDFGNIIQFASGGYTGEWSSDHGALAILHNKELVLNEDDTSNFLKATSLLRDISQINGSIEDSIMASILGMMNALSPRIGGFSAGSSGSQESSGNIFNITAEFPNANDVTSIREAILSLPNIASQYVHQR